MQLQKDNGEETTNRCDKQAPEKKDEWWQKQWKSDNMAVYQVDNYTPWKSLYRQGENLPYTAAELEENFIELGANNLVVRGEMGAMAIFQHLFRKSAKKQTFPSQ